jgi:hypothetical protein
MSLAVAQNPKPNLRVGQNVRFIGAWPCDAKIVKMTPKGGVIGDEFNRLTLKTLNGDLFECDEWNVQPKHLLDV